jgi:addiction module RelE/StbE family toxin
MTQFKIELHRTVKNDLKKITLQAAREIVNKIFIEIKRNPFSGIPLAGPLSEYWKFSFHFRGINYRIVYKIYNQENIIFIIAVGKRSEFYKRFLRRVR